MNQHEDVGNLTAHHLEMVERSKRRNNIVIMGLWIESDDEEVIKEELRDFFVSAFRVDAAIVNVTKVNHLYFKVKFYNLRDKAAILRKRHRLRNAAQKINIFADWTDQEREIAHKIGLRAQAERMKGNEIKTGYMTLYINQNKWVWNHEKNDLVYVGPATFMTHRI